MKNYTRLKLENKKFKENSKLHMNFYKIHNSNEMKKQNYNISRNYPNTKNKSMSKF